MGKVVFAGVSINNLITVVGFVVYFDLITMEWLDRNYFILAIPVQIVDGHIAYGNIQQPLCFPFSTWRLRRNNSINAVVTSNKAARLPPQLPPPIAMVFDQTFQQWC